MEVATLATVVLAVCVSTSAFNPASFKPVIFGQNLNKFFGLSIQGPFKDGREASLKYTSGINGGVDIVPSGAETVSKTSVSSLDHIHIDIPKTPTSPTLVSSTPQQKLTSSTKTDVTSSTPQQQLTSSTKTDLTSSTLQQQLTSSTKTDLTSSTPQQQLTSSTKTDLTSSTPQQQLTSSTKTDLTSSTPQQQLTSSTKTDLTSFSPQQQLTSSTKADLTSSTPQQQLTSSTKTDLTSSTPQQQLTSSTKSDLTLSTSDAENISNALHETTIPTTPRRTTNSKKIDVQKEMESLFLTSLQKTIDLESHSRKLGIIPPQADQIERQDKRIPLSFYKLSARVMTLTNAVLDFEKYESFTEGAEARFSDRQYAGTLATADIKTPAGMAFSNVHKDVIYVINNGDAGLDTSITALNKTGDKLNAFVLAGAHNNDWAALQIAPCSTTSSRSCIYIGDIDKQHKNKKYVSIIYICEEPDDIYSGNKLELKETIKIKDLDEHGMVMLVTPKADIFVITQHKHESPVYKIEDGTAKQVCLFRFESQWSGPIDGDISADGDMMLIKTYDFVYYFFVPDKKYTDALCSDTERVTLRYTDEYKGKVVTFNPDAMSYYTCTMQLYSPLWRYDRLKV